jgi:hypothetical protein
MFAGMAIVLGLMANFVKNLFIDVSPGRTQLLYQDYCISNKPELSYVAVDTYASSNQRC